MTLITRRRARGPGRPNSDDSPRRSTLRSPGRLGDVCHSFFLVSYVHLHTLAACQRVEIHYCVNNIKFYVIAAGTVDVTYWRVTLSAVSSCLFMKVAEETPPYRSIYSSEGAKTVV